MKIEVKITRDDLKEGAFSKRVKTARDSEKGKDRDFDLLVQLMRRSVI